MSLRPFAFLFGLIALQACTQFPELDARVPASELKGAYPKLLPLDQLLDAPAPQVTPKTIGNMQSRIAGLRARAARLKRPVINAPTKARMRRGVGPI